ncbi:MAG: hypothetical protein LUH15_02400 [Tannerellaceae bacterium]|nr:hypothetical protein [Tannerellaceae bacterium]
MARVLPQCATMMKRQYSILILYFLCFAIGNATSNSYLDSLLKELDLAISKDGQYREQKENYLFLLRARLTIPNLTIEDQYDIYSRLTDEFEYYRCDSARYYGSKKLALAVESDKLSWIIESKIKLATILSHTALFREGIELLDSISPDDLSSAQESEYYKAYYEVYVAWSDFLYNEFREYQIDLKRDTYHELFISSPSRNRYEYAAYYGIKYVNNNEPEKAEELLLNSLPQYSLGTRPYSILTSVVSSLYLSKGDLVKTKEYLALSAISDIRGILWKTRLSVNWQTICLKKTR